VTRTSSERVSRAVEAMERAEAGGSEDEAQLAFDALLYRLVVIGEAVKALPAAPFRGDTPVPAGFSRRPTDYVAGQTVGPPVIFWGSRGPCAIEIQQHAVR
jgi:hypothetical protein